MSDDTPLLSLPLLLPSQAQKHVTHNEALRLLDVLVQLAVTDRTRTEPPAAPEEGDRHLIAAGATGAWAGRANQIAAFTITMPGAPETVFDGGIYIPNGLGQPHGDIRLDPEEEFEGADLSIHKISATPERAEREDRS